MDFFTQENDKAVCLLCAHYCKLKEGQRGICGVNQNKNGKITNLVYARPIALHVDPVEKKPLYHFLPGSKTLSLGTIGCNFHCSFCQNWSISQERVISSGQRLEPWQIIRLAKENACASISFTYNEPTIFYPYAKDIAILAHEEGIQTTFVSNGFMSHEVREDMLGTIDALNIDLKSFSFSYYKKRLKGKLETVLDNLKYFKEKGIWLEITTLIVPNQNDSQEELTSMASFIKNQLGEETPWHISAFHPDYKEKDLPPTPHSSLMLAKRIGEDKGLKHIYLGNTREENPTQCVTCKEILLQRDGFGVSENRLIEGRCPTCKTKLAGVYDDN